MSDSNPYAAKSDADLLAERERVARQLWTAQPATANHQQLETRYNGLERERFTRAGNDPADYKYKHDVRHEFQFEEVRGKNGRLIEQRASMADRPDGSGRYALRPTDEVINWRGDTAVGRDAAQAAQQKVAGGTGDDAGHLIAAQYGADPSDTRNLARQHLVQNEHGAWYQQERQLRDELDKGRRCDIEVNVKYSEADPDRARSRTMHTHDLTPDGHRTGQVRDDKVVYANPSSAASRAHDEGTLQPGGMAGLRNEAHVNQREVKAALQNQDPEAVGEWQRRKEQAAAEKAARGGPRLTPEQRREKRDRMRQQTGPAAPHEPERDLN